MKTHVSVKISILKKLFHQTMSSALEISVHSDPRHPECPDFVPGRVAVRRTAVISHLINLKREQYSKGEAYGSLMDLL